MRFIIPFFLLLLPLGANTTVTQSVVNPDLTPASGVVHIKISQACLAGSNYVGTSVKTVSFTAGAFSVSLVPNDACSPAGTSYQVTWQLSGGQSWTETWLVPTSGSPVSVAAVRAAVPPSGPSLLFSPTQLSQSGATSGQCLTWNGTRWAPADCDTPGSVLSIFGRTGTVTAASGDYNSSQITESGNLYFTTARARAALSVASPLSYNSTTGLLSCPTCGTGSVSSVFGRTGTVTAQSGDYTTSQVSEGSNLYFSNARARSALSAALPIVFNSSTGQISCPTCGTTTGNMAVATYDAAGYASQVEVLAHKDQPNGYPSLNGSGKLSIAEIPTGTSSSTVALGNDSRFSNARTPTAHAASHKNGGSDEVATATPAANAIPKAGSGGKLASGWIPTVAAATALAADPADCGSGAKAVSIDAQGNLTCSAVSLTADVTGTLANSHTTATAANTASAIVARDGSGNFVAGTITAALTGNASTATALAANPADCGAGTKATAIAANGDLTCSAVSLTADVSGTLPNANTTAASANTASAIVARDGSGNFAAGTITATSLILTPHTPASSSEACTAGAVAVDANFLYVCTATDTWKRAALASF